MVVSALSQSPICAAAKSCNVSPVDGMLGCGTQQGKFLVIKIEEPCYSKYFLRFEDQSIACRFYLLQKQR